MIERKQTQFTTHTNEAFFDTNKTYTEQDGLQMAFAIAPTSFEAWTVLKKLKVEFYMLQMDGTGESAAYKETEL